MLVLVLRGLAAGFVVVAVSEIAAKFPRLGALMLTIPVVPAAVLMMMYLKAGDLGAVSGISRQMLVLIAIGLMGFVPLAAAQRLHWPFWGAYVAGVLLVVTGVGAYLWAGAKGA
jgi:hypothetical protein